VGEMAETGLPPIVVKRSTLPPIANITPETRDSEKFVSDYDPAKY
jgi:hypothetical protein